MKKINLLMHVFPLMLLLGMALAVGIEHEYVLIVIAGYCVGVFSEFTRPYKD